VTFVLEEVTGRELTAEDAEIRRGEYRDENTRVNNEGN
jgi:hypothetical protein